MSRGPTSKTRPPRMTPISGRDVDGTSSWASATGYALATFGLVAIGLGLAARRPGLDTSTVTAGALAAWIVQAASFWRLVASLAAGRNALRVWIGGIAARVGGFVVAAVAAASTSVGNELPLAYGVTLVTLLLVEAVWLSRCRWRTGSGGQADGTRKAGR
jgi:hypothetical protein